MASYFVNKQPNQDGAHEVHCEGCSNLPDMEDRIFLGKFLNCNDAVLIAQRIFDRASCCAHCAPEGDGAH